MATINEIKGKLTVKKLKQVLYYDPKTGLFTWLIKPAKRSKRGYAGSYKNGYIRISIDGFVYRAHRLAWFYMTGSWPENQIDHKDTVRSNNKWSNLRPAINLQNSTNRGKNKNNTSGYKGVYWSYQRDKWMAKINIGEKQIHLGAFKNPFLAHITYEEATKAYNKEFGRAK